MKLNKLLLVLSATLLASCTNPSSSVAPSSSTEAPVSSDKAEDSSVVSSSISNVEVDASWTSDEINAFNTIVGEVLPKPAFTKEYYFDTDTDETGEFIYVGADYEREELVDEYIAVLESVGYEYFSSDDEYGYTVHLCIKEVEDGTIVAQIDYFPGSDEYAPGFELYAWFESGDPSGSETDYLESDTFPQQAADDFIASINSTAVIPAFESSYYLYYYEAGSTLEIMAIDDNSDLEATYTAALESASYTIDDSYYDYFGYMACDANLEVVLMYFSYEGTFYLYVYPYEDSGSSEEAVEDPLTGYEDDIYYHSTSFPASFVEEFYAEFSLNAVIPGFEATDYYFYRTYNAEYDLSSARITCEDLTNEIEVLYTEILTAAGWVIDDSLYDEYGYFATHPSYDVEIQYYSYEGAFGLFLYSENVNSGSSGEVLDEELVSSNKVVIDLSEPFPTAYNSTPTSYTLGGYEFDLTYVANYIKGEHFQFKKAQGVMECKTAIENLYYVQVNYHSSNTNYLSCYGKIDETSEWVEIPANDHNQFDLTGYTYFKLVNNSNACYVTSIEIALAESL